MFERFTDRARRALKLANQEARELRHNFIGTEHLLLGLINEGEGVAARALAASGVSLEAAREKVSSLASQQIVGTAADRPPFTPRAKKVLELSLREALALGHNYIGTEHLLLGLMREDKGVGIQVLEALEVDLGTLRSKVQQLLEAAAPDVPGTRSQRIRQRLRPTGMETADPPRPAGTVEISFGKFSQTIADPELAEALSKINPDQLHASLRQAVLPPPTA